MISRSMRCFRTSHGTQLSHFILSPSASDSSNAAQLHLFSISTGSVASALTFTSAIATNAPSYTLPEGEKECTCFQARMDDVNGKRPAETTVAVETAPFGRLLQTLPSSCSFQVQR